MRWDSALLVYLAGAASVLCAQGLYQILVTKGFTIAVELMKDGWTPERLERHRKAARMLPWLEGMRRPKGAALHAIDEHRESEQ